MRTMVEQTPRTSLSRTAPRRPDFFIVGAPKCGTSALYVYLRAHPEVFMPEVKEPEFFAEDILGDRRSVRTLQEYSALFQPANGHRRIGEASTAYLASSEAAHRIKAFNPSARIIIMVRNPIDLMHAFHNQLLNNGHETITDFESALKADEQHIQNGATPRLRVACSYRQTAHLSHQISGYLTIFGREKVHVIVFDEFKADVAKAYRETLDFLGIHSQFSLPFETINPNRRSRSRLLQRMLRNPPPLIKAFTHALMPRFARRAIGSEMRRLNTVVEPRRPMPAALRARLIDEFKGEIRDLGDLLQRDFSHWTV